jgi:hypothetical protein
MYGKDMSEAVREREAKCDRLVIDCILLSCSNRASMASCRNHTPLPLPVFCIASGHL